MAERPQYLDVPPTYEWPAARVFINRTMARVVDLLSLQQQHEIRAVSAATVLEIGTRQLVVRADATAGAFSVTLPLARNSAGRALIVKRVSSLGTVTVAAAGTDTIDGAATIALASQWQTVRLIADADRNAWLLG